MENNVSMILKLTRISGGGREGGGGIGTIWLGLCDLHVDHFVRLNRQGSEVMCTLLPTGSSWWISDWLIRKHKLKRTKVHCFLSTLLT